MKLVCCQRESTGPRQFDAIEGFRQDDALALRGDLIAGEPQWRNANWSQLEGQLVSLQIHLSNASIYSFWTRTESDHPSLVNLVDSSDSD